MGVKLRNNTVIVRWCTCCYVHVRNRWRYNRKRNVLKLYLCGKCHTAKNPAFQMPHSTNNAAKATLHKQCCEKPHSKGSAAKVKFQEYCCSDGLPRIVLAKPCSKNSTAKATLKEQCCKSHISRTVLQKPLLS